MPFTINRHQLLLDVYSAYKDARRHKRFKPYQQNFERHLETNLFTLCDELWNRTYRPRPSSCFIISDPKLREVFAADFRDRIVHHLYFNYVYDMFLRTFIQDSYSCIKGKGTLYGIRRLEHHIREESQNYTEQCYVLKLDVKGYFMHIGRQKLLDITLNTIEKMAKHRVSKHSMQTWEDIVDIDFLKYLTREIVFLDPTKDCEVHGNRQMWYELSHDKSLFHSPPGCGLPIGNLTSQLFSNVYLNELDQWMKRTLHCRHYGRYVDDFYVVNCDREWLKSIIPEVRAFISERLGLSLQEGKVRICDVRMGVEFLGAYIKPHRTYVSHTTLRRMSKKITQLEHTLPDPDPEHLRSSLSSILGLMRQHSSWHLRERLAYGRFLQFTEYGRFDNELTKFVPYSVIKKR